MRILFLSQRVPYPPNRGDKITTWRIIERLRRDHEVTCFCFQHEEEDEKHAQALREKGFDVRLFPYRKWAGRFRAAMGLLTGRPLTLAFFASNELQAAVDEQMRITNFVYAYSGCMGAFVEKHGQVPRVMHFGDLDSDKWRQYAESKSGLMRWVYRREQKTLFTFEERLARSFSDNVVCTGAEKALFEKFLPGAPCTILKNGVDLEFFHPRDTRPEKGLLVFTGVMDYFPNIDGCIHFADEVFPLVRERHPEARFAVVGSKPTPEVKALAARDGIEVTGFVDDIRDWLGKAAVAVVPLRIARGIQNKVLEAMAMGVPVVCTTPAARGVGGEAGTHFLVADSAKDQARAVSGLLGDPERAKALADAGRAFVEANYDWERVMGTLDEMVSRCCGSTTQV